MERARKTRWLGCAAAALCLAIAAGCGRAGDDAREARERHMRRASAAKRAQDIDGAMEWCRKALRKNPDLALAHSELATMYDGYLEDYEMAIYHYRRYLELRPGAENADAVEDLIRHCRISIAAQVAESPLEWRRDFAARTDRIRELEREVAARKSAGAEAGAAPAAAAPAAAAQREARPPRAQAAAPAAAPAALEGRTHVVQAGETLGTISSRYYGTPAKWAKIYEANKDRMGGPNSLRVGTTLSIPKD